MSELQATLDYIQTKKFKKETGYEASLDKMLNQATKAKVGKSLYEVRSKGDTMKFRTKGKKTAPINILDYFKIRNLKKTSSDKKAIAFAYPGPDEKSPIMLYALRFEKEEGYEKFTDRIEFPPTSEYQCGMYTPATNGRTSRYAEQEYLENGYKSASDREKPRKLSSTKKRGTTPTTVTTLSSSSSVSSTSTHPQRKSRSKTPGKGKMQSLITFISTDNVTSLYQGRDVSPFIAEESQSKTSYVSTKARIRRLSPSSRRAYSPRPCRWYSPWSSRSSSISDCARLRRRSRNCPITSDDECDEDYYERSVSGRRKCVISRCCKEPCYRVRCHPVGKFTVPNEMTRFFCDDRC